MGDVAAAPANYEDFYWQYGGYIRGLVRKLGVAAQDADDVTSNIVYYLLRADVIGQFRPGFTVVHQGTEREVRFKAFLSAKVALYVKGQREKIGKRQSREILIADRPGDDGTPWVELFGGAQWWDDYSGLDAEEFVDRMRVHLALQPPLSDRCSLLALFDELLREVREEGAVSIPELGERFGVPAPIAAKWLERLRAILKDPPAQAPRAVSWVVGGVRLGIPEVRTAISALEAAAGYLVKPCLDKAGHPLRDAEPKWYNALAAEELKLYPGLDIFKAEHCVRAGPVKSAVLHRLYRMLAEAAPPPPPEEPEPEPDTPLDLIEAGLWKLGLDSARVGEIMGLVEVRELASA